jgi:hypothetical protein
LGWADKSTAFATVLTRRFSGFYRRPGESGPMPDNPGARFGDLRASRHVLMNGRPSVTG